MTGTSAEHHPPSPPERSLWRGGPSQVLNLHIYLIDAAIGLAIIAGSLVIQLNTEDSRIGVYIAGLALLPALHALWRWIELACRAIEVSSQRIELSTGVFSRVTDDLELYRVRDLTIRQPLVHRLFGLGDIVMETSDRTHPTMILAGIHQPRELRDLIRENVEERRRVTRTREVDFDGGDPTDADTIDP
ncbi:PH domain-containing protein [Mucisphaera sp.]|uniref:PH domain-containing protein n=1 Tax=Mucisphaera sp. TaxID=2913024 RepID=UPI003D098FAF